VKAGGFLGSAIPKPRHRLNVGAVIANRQLDQLRLLLLTSACSPVLKVTQHSINLNSTQQQCAGCRDDLDCLKEALVAS